MAILVTCLCGKRLKLRDSLAGKRVKCPECEQKLDVPDVADASPSNVFGFAVEENRNCTECGATMKPEARRCSKCGFDTRTGTKAGEIASKATPQCPICDGPLENSEDCPACSAAQAALGAAAGKGKSKRNVPACPKCNSENCQKITLKKRASSGALRLALGGLIGGVLVPDASNKSFQCNSCGALW